MQIKMKAIQLKGRETLNQTIQLSFSFALLCKNGDVILLVMGFTYSMIDL